MRLMSATINGFGNWVDQPIDFENESFVCIYGGNEAGKSTMQQFILFMLFGFSPKWRTFYRPKTSSRMGGRLRVWDGAIGEYTIERFDEVRNARAICYTSDGNEHPESWLKDRLQGMTYETYQSIFSFSAVDLYHIRTMSEADLGDVLLNIGLTGSKNILAIEKDLDSRMGELFKPNGTKPVMNQQIGGLDELSAELSRHGDEEAAYRKKKTYIHSLEERWTTLQKQYQDEKDAYSLFEKQQQALPLIKDYKYCIERLNAYPDSLSFPENGLERLRRLNESVLPLKSELAFLEDKYGEYDEKKHHYNQHLYDEKVYEEAETILSMKQSYMDIRRDIKKLLETIAKEKTQVQTEFEQLQLDLTMDDLGEMSFPFHLERTWNELKQMSDQVDFERNQSEDDYFLIKEQMDTITSEQEKLETAIPDEEKIIRLTEVVDAFHQQEYVQSQMEKEADNKIKWTRMVERKKKQSHLIAAGCGLLAVILAVLTMMGVTPQSFYTLSSGALIVGIGQWVLQKRSRKSLSEILTANAMPEKGSFITENEKNAATHQLHMARKHEQTLQAYMEKKQTLEIQMLQWEEKRRGLRAKEERLTRHIQEQYDIYPFLKEINIAYWAEIYQKLNRLKQFMQNINKQNGHLSDLYAEQETIQQRLMTFLNNNAIQHDNENLDLPFELLDDIMVQYHNCCEQMKQYEEWMEKNKRDQDKIHQQMMTYEEEIQALYKHANVDTAESFYKTANQLDDRNALLSEKHQLEHHITSIITHAEFKEMVSVPVHSFDLQGRMKQSELKMNELTDEIEDVRQKMARENVELTNMETSGSHSEIKHRFQMEKEKLQNRAYEWSVLKTAREMLNDTKRIYRDKYLQKVIDKTSVYFSTLTGGRYTRIYAPSDNHLFQVESEDFIRYNVRELSKGTIDQLYISLRIAISDVLSGDSTVPFIIDDALVHFDAIRTERMMHVFAELSKRRQVIILTSDDTKFQSVRNGYKIDLNHNAFA